MAIKYGMQKKAKKMANGGPCDEHGTHMCKMCHGGMYAEGGYAEVEAPEDKEYSHKVLNSRSAPIYHKGKWIDTVAPKEVERTIDNYKKNKSEHKMAEGGFVEEEEESGYMPRPEEHPDHMDAHPVENQDDHEDMVGRIMKKRMMHSQRYSEGGRVANDTPPDSEFEPNQFDDLVKDDDLEEHYTSANSGDEIGNHQEDEDRRDIIARIMKSRRLKDKNPRPA